MSVPDFDRLTFLPGDVVAGRYQAVHRIAKGGTAEVWAVRHLALDELFAMKVLAPEFDVGEDTLSRFDLEARVGASLGRKSHHIVPVTDHGWHHGQPFLVMPFIDGPSVDDVLADGPLGLSESARIVRHVTRALVVAHSVGVLHRDLKPANVLLERQNGRIYARVTDFGIARPAPGADLRRDHLTLRGMFVGTPSVMSPEQATGDELDHRCDVWALGCIAYRCLVGREAFGGGTVLEVLTKVCTARFDPPSAVRPELPVALDALFARAFATEIDARFQDATSFDEAFARACGMPPRAPQLHTHAWG